MLLWFAVTRRQTVIGRLRHRWQDSVSSSSPHDPGLLDFTEIVSLIWLCIFGLEQIKIMTMKLLFIHLFILLFFNPATLHLNRREQKMCSIVQHFDGILKSIISADNKPHIVVFLGITFSLKTQKAAERKPAGSADSNLSIDAELKDVDGVAAQRKITASVHWNLMMSFILTGWSWGGKQRAKSLKWAQGAATTHLLL